MAIVTALVIETYMAIVTVLVIKTDMAIVTVLASKPAFIFPKSNRISNVRNSFQGGFFSPSHRNKRCRDCH